MQKNTAICNRILAQFDQMHFFVTDKRIEALCVAILKSEGFVEATVVFDEENGRYSATVQGLTTAGINALKAINTSRQAHPAQAGFSDAANSQMAMDDESDRTLLTLTGGGIALAFGTLPLFKTWTKAMLLCWLGAAVLWVLSLFGLMLSYWTSKRAFAALDEKKVVVARVFSTWTKILNWFDTSMFIIGVVVFAAFAIQVGFGLLTK